MGESHQSKHEFLYYNTHTLQAEATKIRAELGDFKKQGTDQRPE